MNLTPSDINTALWRRLREHMEETRQELRVANDSKNLDERETAYKRGRIAQLTELIAMAEPSPE